MFAIYWTTLGQTSGRGCWTPAVHPNQFEIFDKDKARELCLAYAKIFPDKRWAYGGAYQDGLWEYDSVVQRFLWRSGEHQEWEAQPNA